MATSTHDVRSSTNKTQETDSISQRPRSGQNSRTPHSLPSALDLNEPAPRDRDSFFKSLVDTNPKIKKFLELEKLATGLSKLERDKMLIGQFSSETDLSMELYDKVVDGRASEEEKIKYAAKADSLNKRTAIFCNRVAGEMQVALWNFERAGREVATLPSGQWEPSPGGFLPPPEIAELVEAQKRELAAWDASRPETP
ncbi:MAG: hypothetical protein RLZZ609_857 [Cyanobacteriota bacterium]|jgi:hypothetical protein